MKQSVTIAMVGMGMVGLLWAVPAEAAPPKDPPTKCAPDAALVGSVCVDKYETSVWRIPDPLVTNKKLAKKVRQGKATVADLTAGGATQLGVGGDDYAPCTDNGQTCKDDIYAASLPGVTPSAFITWFQANVACANAGKRLPSNAEWQMAVTGTQDPGPDNGTTDCNTASVFSRVATGSRSSCVSAFGAFDMVGNVYEWVADWVARSTTCLGWGGFSNDDMCLAGAATSGTQPGALLRGGDFFDGALAGPLTVNGSFGPSLSSASSAIVAPASHLFVAPLALCVLGSSCAKATGGQVSRGWAGVSLPVRPRDTRCAGGVDPVLSVSRERERAGGVGSLTPAARRGVVAGIRVSGWDQEVGT